MRRPRFDRLTAGMVGLIFAFQAGALLLAPVVAGFELPTDGQSTSVELGLGYVGLIIAESIALVAVWRVWKRLPDLAKTVIKFALIASFVGIVAYLSYQAGELRALVELLVVWGVVMVGVLLLERKDLIWIVFDLMAIGFGIILTAVIGTLAAPIVVIPALVLMMVWDHYAVNLSDLMGDLVELSSSAGLPNYLIIPNRLYVDTDAVQEYIRDPEEHEKPKGVTSVIGVGDFAFPALLTVSAWVAGSELAAMAALVGTGVAMVYLRDAMNRSEGGLPALPWLNTGALVGFALGTVLSLGVALV